MKKFDTINVIPFIDIMLVLLAIVLTTATFVTNGALDITLPQSNSTPSIDNINSIELAVNRDGLLFLDGEESTLPLAERYLRTLNTDTPIILLMDEKVEFKHFVAVVDLLKQLSLDKVSILTRNND